MTTERSGYSALIITKNRDEHLQRTLEGLRQQSITPTEIIVVFMNQPALRLDGCKTLECQSKNPLPLAEARNMAANAAVSERLVFLDVDCIPSATFGAEICRDLDQNRGLIMGTPRYLAADCDFDIDLMKQSKAHPARPQITGPSDRYELFWSLCFATTAAHFASVGGFDEQFVGYGGEDTDLAFSYRQHAIPYAQSGATAFHQYHDSFRPPLNHFDDVVTNSRRFFDKWKIWPMKSWLNAFVDYELIKWSAHGSTLDVIREPEPDEVQAARSTDLFA